MLRLRRKALFQTRPRRSDGGDAELVTSLLRVQIGAGMSLLHSKNYAEKDWLQKPTGAGRLLPANQNLRQDRRVGWVYAASINSLGGKEVPTGTCPECDADVHVDTDIDKGESVSCEECGTELEVVGLDPVELDIVEEDDLDEDEDEDEF